jgi:phosphoribosylaminoimidazolecarboxamide formyltransferase / IMP cyclohydrolase
MTKSPLRPLRVLISVADKSGLEDLARRLAALGAELLSTGGTARLLRDLGLPVTDVAEITGFPEIMDGRVKTLHPLVHGGLLGRPAQDAEVMRAHGIRPIDLLVVNLYPFEATVARPGCTRADAIENIDIGGPAMIRAAAKNHQHVGVIVDPGDYPTVAGELEAAGQLSEQTRRALARKAFAHTSTYDAAVWGWLRANDDDQELPQRLPLGLTLRERLRYGENPHQRGALYTLPGRRPGTVVSAEVCQGKALSYNNVADADAALDCVRALPTPACVIVKHANPCGVGLASSPLASYEKAYATDPTSAFGGIIAFNAPVDADVIDAILARQFVEVIVAPAFSAAALESLRAKPNVRVLATGPLEASAAPQLRVQQVAGGLLVQDEDLPPGNGEWRVASSRQPSAAETADAELAWTIARFVKSNAIVLVRDGATIGIGAGQMSRVMSVRIAAWKADEAGLDVRGAVLASDAFFPFRDGIDLAAEFGIAAIVHPGGSLRDQEVIGAADEHGMAMWLTGIRHFRH